MIFVGNLYFTNAFESETLLEVHVINTTYRMILLKSSHDQPRDLAVSPKLRYLFWTDGGQTPKIERALLDGTNRTVLASESLASPRGLTVDYTNDFLYWTDDVLDMISRMAPDGTQRQIIRYGSRYPSPIGVAIYGNDMLWVDKKLGKLFQASKDNASSVQPEVRDNSITCKTQFYLYSLVLMSPIAMLLCLCFWYQVIRDNLDGLMDVAIFDVHVQPTAAHQVGFNPCYENNGHCQQLCFAIPDQDHPKCGCAHGSLLSNGVICGYGLDEFLVFTTDYTINSLRLDPEDHSVPYPTVDLSYGVMALDYDFKEKLIFFTHYMGIGHSRIGYISTTSPTNQPVMIATSEFSSY